MQNWMRISARTLILIGAVAASCVGGCPATNNNANANANENANSNDNANSSRPDPAIVVPGVYLGPAACDAITTADGASDTGHSSNAVSVILDAKNNVTINGTTWSNGASIGTLPGPVFKVTGILTTSSSILIRFTSSETSATQSTTGNGSHLLAWKNDRTIDYRQTYMTTTETLVVVPSSGGTVTTTTETKESTQEVDCTASLTR